MLVGGAECLCTCECRSSLFAARYVDVGVVVVVVGVGVVGVVFGFAARPLPFSPLKPVVWGGRLRGDDGPVQCERVGGGVVACKQLHDPGFP